MYRSLRREGYAVSYSVEGTGPRIVWVDPALGSSTMRPMQPAIDALADRFEVVTYDRRGRGRNRPSGTTVADEIADLAALVDHLGAVTAVLGFSSGGALVVHAAPRVDTGSIVLLEPAIDTEPDDSGLRQEIAAAITAGDDAAAVLTFYDAIGVPDEIVDELRESDAWPHLTRSAPTLLADIDLAYLGDEAIEAVRTPAHIIVSSESPEEITAMSDTLAERLGTRVWREPGGWHGVDADALAARLEALLQT